MHQSPHDSVVLVHHRSAALVGVGLLIIFVSAASGVAANGPVAYFPFNGSTDDASGYGNHAVALGAVPTQDRSGNPNSAYLVGDHGYLEAADSNSLDITAAYSISLWFRQDNMISSRAVLAGKGINTAFAVWIYYGGSYTCPDPSAERAIQVSVGGANNRFIGGPFFDCSIGEWRHVAVTVFTETNGAHTASLYVDGSYVDTIGMLGDFTNNAAPLGIGKDGESPYRFAGAIDDLRLYDRVLEAAEITALFDSLLIDGFESGSTSSWISVFP